MRKGRRWRAELPQLYSVEFGGPGRLSIMTRPHPSALRRTAKLLRRNGVDVVLFTVRRTHFWQTDDLKHEVLWWPIPEHGVPFGDDGGLLAQLVERLRAGQHVVVSCRLGLGRSPMVAAALLTDLGLSPDAAHAALSKARGRLVPHGRMQREWVRQRAAVLATR